MNVGNWETTERTAGSGVLMLPECDEPTTQSAPQEAAAEAPAIFFAYLLQVSSWIKHNPGIPLAGLALAPTWEPGWAVLPKTALLSYVPSQADTGFQLGPGSPSWLKL